MQVVKNPKEYDNKLPTNVRLERDMKQRALKEAKERATTLSDVVNDALKERYK